MKNKMFAAIMPIILGITSYLGYGSVEDIPIDAVNQKSDFSAEESAKLKAALGEDYEKTMKGIDQVIKDFHNKDMNAKSLADGLKALVKENQLLLDANADTNADNPDDDAKANLELLKVNLETLNASKKDLEDKVKKLMLEGVGDAPLDIVKGIKNMKNHSATHLFASGQLYDAFENRPWNQRLRDGSFQATSFNDDSYIPTLQDDIAHFVRENPTGLTSLFEDTLGLPAEWSRRTGVLDRVADGFIIPGSIVQARAKGWSPKNKFKIEAEEGKVFRKKIDITFVGWELQNIENTWIRTYNGSDGSHPWKNSFVAFLLSEIVKRQMRDDRIAQINGIYSDNFGGDNNPGENINSQDGLRYLFWYHREVSKKFKAFDLGVPTESNIVDYVKNLIMSLPEIERKEPGLELGLSQAWLDAYRVRAGLLYQLHRTPDTGSAQYDRNSPIDYPNIKFQPLIDMVQTDFMYITDSNNIEILDYNVNEKSKFTTTRDKRDTHIFADYRLGIRFKFVGMKRANGEPVEFERQEIWSNSVPIFDKNVKIPLYDNTSGILNFHYNNMVVSDNWKTNITQIDNVPVGMIIRITGNTGLVASKNLVKNAQLDLTDNFDLSTGGTLTLIAKQDGTLKELKRTTAPEPVATTDKTFASTTLDATNGNVFKYAGATSTLANILGGFEGKEITIYGSETAGVVLTVSDVPGSIDVASSATLDSAAKYIKLASIDGVWLETARG